MKLKNVLRTLKQCENQEMHITHYIGLRSYGVNDIELIRKLEADKVSLCNVNDIINAWKADEATDYIVLIDYRDGDEDLSISDLWDRVY